jgi:alkyldihydroxyacetonephosphate synthase
VTTPRARSWWGWGWEDQQLGTAALEGLGQLLVDRFGRRVGPVADPVDPHAMAVPAPRVELPDHLAPLGSLDPVDRLRHGHGNAFRDVVRALHGDVPRIPDAVVRPGDDDEVEAVLEWCSARGVACVPWGGGTSVVGGVTPPEGPAISLDLERLDRVLEVDEVSGAARVQAGTLGPALEGQLRPAGLTFRHFPQSWEFSTLGGWIVTRAGGHFATGPTHVDDLVEAISAVTPSGRWSSRRVPASGAGPSPDRLLLGSEGILGVVTEAWIRVQRRPRSRAQATLAFVTTSAALAAVRALVQDGLQPANCRVLDPVEAALAGAAAPDATETLVVLGFEALEAPLDVPMARALELVADHGGEVRDGPSSSTGDRTGTAAGGAGAWRAAFLQAPYLRDGLARLGAVVETFETATTWNRADELVATLRETATRAAQEACGGAMVAVRTTHAYPDGVAPYLTVVAPGPGEGLRGPARGRAQAAAWDEIKVAVSEAIDAAGATITHHHAVGRDHRPWYDRQRPGPFAASLRAAKAALDPAGILNPGVLVDPFDPDEVGSPRSAGGHRPGFPGSTAGDLG